MNEFLKINQDSQVIRVIPTNPLFFKVKYHDREICPSIKGQYCDMCEYYKNNYQDRIIKDFKPIERFFYQVLVDGRVKTWAATKSLHEKIINGIANIQKPKVKLPWYNRLWNWIKGWFIKTELKSWSVLDLEDGFDFKIIKIDKSLGSTKIPSYENSYFIAKSRPAGPPEKIEQLRNIKPLNIEDIE